MSKTIKKILKEWYPTFSTHWKKSSNCPCKECADYRIEQALYEILKAILEHPDRPKYKEVKIIADPTDLSCTDLLYKSKNSLNQDWLDGQTAGINQANKQWEELIKNLWEER